MLIWINKVTLSAIRVAPRPKAHELSGDCQELFVVMQHKSSLHSPNDRFVITRIRLMGIFKPDRLAALQRKRAAELAFWVQQVTFSESTLSAKYAKLRGFPAILRGKPQTFSAGAPASRINSILDFNSPT